MSNSLERAVRDLTLAVRALTIATQSLSSSTSTARPGECGSDYLIEVVAESYEQFYFADCRLARAFSGVETGPPTLPDLLRQFAEEKLQLVEPELSSRANRAFKLGFWASVALDCHTNFETEDSVPGDVISHWVILRSPFNFPFRVNSFNDLVKFVDIQDPRIVYQSFATITEVELFCCGAGKSVPELWRAGNPN